MNKMIFTFMLLLAFMGVQKASAEPIQDNSFLVEEAYNQEPGVVQFINVWQKAENSDDWTYTFINELPLFSQDHQISYEIPVSYLSANKENVLEDIKLNYRYEFFRGDGIVTTGRLSVVAPTGDYKKGAGSNAMGYEASMIASIKITENWYQHWNLGAGVTPGSQAANGDKADTSKIFWAASQVYLLTDSLNFMLELAGSSEEVVSGADSTTWEHSMVMSPSIRYGIDVGEWQFVPGLAVPMGIGPNAGENQILAYFSIEGKLW